MAFTIAVFLAQVDGLISSNDDELSQLRRQRFIKAALERYSADKPDEVTEDVSGDGGKYYPLASSLASFVEGFSRILSIEYPAEAVSEDSIPVYLESEDWNDDYWQGGTRYLLLPNHSPAASETIRIRYTAPYLWTASSDVTVAIGQEAHGFSVDDYVYHDTTWLLATDERIATHKVTAVADVDNFTAAMLEASPDVNDFFAICNLAACNVAQALADKYSRTADSTISADSVDHLSRAQQWAARAKELCARYENHLGLDRGEDGGGTREKAAGEFVDFDTAPGWPSGRKFIFHGGGNR